MKFPALLLCLLAAVLSALPLNQARADEVSFDVFYNSLADDGDWYNTPEYGYVWQPSIAYQNDKWRPYSDGYWAQTDDGWTWVSYENFGWATYHYGRWTRLENVGWVWVPGYEWGPGWVSWRSNDDYVGWAPLPPRREGAGSPTGRSSISIDYNDVEPEDGYTNAVDTQYDIGPDNYCFVQVRDFGAPVLREVIVPPARNIIIIENTVNITDITYRRGGSRVVVFNGGPNFEFISRHVSRPIQTLRIERQDNLAFLRDGSRGGHNPNIVRDGVFRIAAPPISHQQVNFTQVKPPRVKQDIRDVKVEHGWTNTGADPATIQRLHQQFQQQAREPATRPPGGTKTFTTPAPFDGRRPETTERTNGTPARSATPPVNPTPPRGNSDADKAARRDAAQREKDLRDAEHNNASGFQTPPHQPSVAPHNPPGEPANTPERDVRRHNETSETTGSATPANTKGETRHGTPRPLATPPQSTPAPREANPEHAPHHQRDGEGGTPTPAPRNLESATERRVPPTQTPQEVAPRHTTEETTPRHNPEETVKHPTPPVQRELTPPPRPAVQNEPKPPAPRNEPAGKNEEDDRRKKPTPGN